MIRGGSTGLTKSQVLDMAQLKAWANKQPALERVAMASAPTVTSGASATLAQFWPSTTFSGASQVNRVTGSYFRYVKTGNIQPNSATGSSIVKGANIQYDTAPTYQRSNMGILVHHDGQNVEFRATFTSTGYALFKVNDQYVSLTPGTYASGTHYIKLAFGARAKRKIEMIIWNSGGTFAGVYTDANDTIAAGVPNGPKCVLVGDSFAVGTGVTTYGSLNSFATILGDLLGWDDFLFDAIGSTGYLADASGVSLKYRDRCSRGVIEQAPDVVIFTGGYNDRTQTQAAIYAEALALFNQIKAALPNIIIVACEPFWVGDVSGYRSAVRNIIPVRDGLKAACEAVGGVWVNGFLEGDLPVDENSPLSGTLKDAVTGGATTFKSDTYFPGYSTVEIGATAGAKDRVMIASSTFSSPTWTYTIFSSATSTIYGSHDAGAPIVQVGNGFWTGTGKVGTTTGVGNCDLLVSSDGVHPSDAGHQALAAWAALRIVKALMGY